MTVPERGFTLVEMLVAMVIFGVLAAGGVGLLRASVDTQGAIDHRLDRVNGQERLAALFTADLGQALARPVLGLGEDRQLSFEGTPSSLALMRGGWANPDDLPRSNVQRVQWTRRQADIARVAHLFLDGSDPGQPAVILRDSDSFALRYRRADGTWAESFSSTKEELLPAAVELTVQVRGQPPLIVVAALPPRGLEPEPDSEPAEAEEGQ